MPALSPPPAQPRILRITALVGGAALFSRVLGLVRDMSMAWLLGNSLAADALVLALRLPHVLRRLLGEGALSMTFTADFARDAQYGPSPLARAVGLRLGCILALIVVLGEALAHPLLLLLAPGGDNAGVLTEQAVPLLRLCLPYAFTAGMAALGMAVLHSLQRFLLPALMPALFNIVVLAFAACAALGLAPAVWLLACGVLCGGLAQWAVQCLALRRWYPMPPGAVPAAPADSGSAHYSAQAWHCLARLPAGVLGAAAPQLAMLGGMIVASLLPQGSVAALYYAERLLELPLGVAGAALGIASLPTLARLASENRQQELLSVASQAVRLSLCITLPATAGLLAVTLPLVQTLFAHGAFDTHAVQGTVLALIGYAPGLPAYGLTRPLLALCHARRQTRLSALSGLVAILTAVGGSLLFTITLPAHLALMGPPLGVTAGLWVQSGLLLRLCRKSLPPEQGVAPILHGGSLLQQLLAALLTGLGAWGATQLPGTTSARLALAVILGMSIYLLALRVVRNPEFMALLHRQGKSEV